MMLRGWTLLIALLLAHSAAAQTAASLTNRGQEMQNWCWAANSEMILDWSGTNTSQTSIADWAVAGADVGNHLDTGSSGWGPFRVPGTNIVFYRKGIKQVLEHFGSLKSDARSSALSETEAKSFLDAQKPFIIALYWSGGGGHVIVAKAYAGSNFQIEDPWPIDFQPRPGNPGVSASVPYTILLGTAGSYAMTVYGSGGGNTWSQTLTLGRSLDIVFLIDSTGSMGPYINNVKSQATNLVNELKATFQDVRIAVVDYRDFPAAPYGTTGDYITKVRTSFTTSAPTAVAAINAISVGGGGDIPEAVFSAVERTALGAEVGGWRAGDSVSRHIILMGDAPGHVPEGWSGGRSLGNCVAALTDPTRPVALQAVHVGGDPAASADFAVLASSSGGQKVSTINASDVAGLIAGIIDDISGGRFPVGSISNPLPTFEWSSPGGGLASSPEVSKLTLELEYNDPRRGWRRFRRFKVSDPTSSSYAATSELPLGEYRWRLSGAMKSAAFQYPDGSTAKQEKLGKFVEEEYTSFEITAVN